MTFRDPMIVTDQQAWNRCARTFATSDARKGLKPRGHKLFCEDETVQEYESVYVEVRRAYLAEGDADVAERPSKPADAPENLPEHVESKPEGYAFDIKVLPKYRKRDVDAACDSAEQAASDGMKHELEVDPDAVYASGREWIRKHTPDVEQRLAKLEGRSDRVARLETELRALRERLGVEERIRRDQRVEFDAARDRIDNAIVDIRQKAAGGAKKVAEDYTALRKKVDDRPSGHMEERVEDVEKRLGALEQRTTNLRPPSILEERVDAQETRMDNLLEKLGEAFGTLLEDVNRIND